MGSTPCWAQQVSGAAEQHPIIRAVTQVFVSCGHYVLGLSGLWRDEAGCIASYLSHLTGRDSIQLGQEIPGIQTSPPSLSPHVELEEATVPCLLLSRASGQSELLGTGRQLPHSTPGTSKGWNSKLTGAAREPQEEPLTGSPAALGPVSKSTVIWGHRSQVQQNTSRGPQ